MKIDIKCIVEGQVCHGQVKLLDLFSSVIQQKKNVMYVRVYNITDCPNKYRNWEYLLIPLTKIAF